eukprot:Sro275_g105870.2  (457) ;mRNA; f:76599-78336
MRALSTLLLLLRMAYTCAISVHGLIDIVLIDAVGEICHPVEIFADVDTDEKQSCSVGSLCFRMHSEMIDTVLVEFEPAPVDWELDEVRLEVNNKTVFGQDSDLRHKQGLLEAGVQLPCGSCLALHATAKKTLSDGTVQMAQVHPLEFNSVSCQQQTESGPVKPQILRRRAQFEIIPPMLQLEQQTCPSYPTRIDFNLTQEFIRDAVQAFEFIKLVFREEMGPIEGMLDRQRQFYASFNGWSDWNDQALVAKTRDTNVCFAVFMATEGNNLIDQFQNIIILNERVDGTDCVVRQGYSTAYFTPYYSEFRAEVDACVRSCSDGLCPLILAGHSQGGAVVASVDLNVYRPTVITFGAPRAIHDEYEDPCTEANPQNHYRFINVLNGEFDRVATQANFFRAKHVGHTLLLDGDDFPIANLGFNDNEDRHPRGDDAHDQILYGDRIKAMLDRGCFPVPVGR